jgi:hypothetical protein
VLRTRNADVAIVGAGIIGLSCAYFLARRGMKVVVFERKLPGSGSSTRNGGGIRSQLGTATNVQLSVLSEQYWAEFEDRFGVDVGLRRIGYLFLAADEDGLQTLRDQVSLQHGFAIPSELLTADDIGARWPSLGVRGAEIRFSCCEAVFVDQPTEPISTLDVVWSRRPDRSEGWLPGIGRYEVERAVRPVAVVVVDEDAKHVLKVPSVEDEEPVETL